MINQTLRLKKLGGMGARVSTRNRNTVAGVLISSLIFYLSSCNSTPAFSQSLTASYYTYESCRREGTSGVWTASGERFNENDLTCALRSRDFGKFYKVTNLDNGKSVIVRHNDFGPNKKLHAKGRIIDLSKGAFKSIAALSRGVINVRVEILK